MPDVKVYERKPRWFPLIAASAKPTRPTAGQAPLLSFRMRKGYA